MSENKEKHRETPVSSGKQITRRELLSKVSPLGRVTLKKADCTGCGICAQECPTGALRISANAETGSFSLLFRHGACVACGECVKICPENCLSVERLLEPEKIDSETVLFEDKIVRCRRCGSPVGPAVMIARLRERIGSSDPEMASRFELCPRCKMQSEFSQLLGKHGHIS
jgi:ferredoxin